MGVVLWQEGRKERQGSALTPSLPATPLPVFFKRADHGHLFKALEATSCAGPTVQWGHPQDQPAEGPAVRGGLLGGGGAARKIERHAKAAGGSRKPPPAREAALSKSLPWFLGPPPGPHPKSRPLPPPSPPALIPPDTYERRRKTPMNTRAAG